MLHFMDRAGYIQLCIGLSVGITPRPDPQYTAFERLSLQEAARPQGPRPCECGLCPCKRGFFHHLKLICVFHHGKTEWESAAHEADSRPSRCWMCWWLDLGHLSLHSCCLQATEFLAFCYSSLNRSKQHVLYLFACHLPADGYLGCEW